MIVGGWGGARAKSEKKTYFTIYVPVKKISTVNILGETNGE